MKKIIIIYMLVLVPMISQAKSSLGKVRALKGKVYAGERQLKIKDEVFKGEVISTKSKSLIVIRLKSGSTIKLMSNSKLKLNAPRGKKGLNLKLGSLFAKVRSLTKKNDKSKLFKVKTRTAVAGVRGTEFFASYGSEKKPDDLWLCVNEGIVEVNKLNSAKSVLVKEGEGISVTASKGISPPRALPWTKKLNWSMDPEMDLTNKVNIAEAYSDLLGEDYD